VFERLRRRIRLTRKKYHYVRRVWHKLLGIHPRECNICGRIGLFRHTSMPPRFDARCPQCGSLERHRHQALWIRANEDKLKGKRILHFAPETCLRPLYRDLAQRYLSADMRPWNSHIQLDIENIEEPDGAWDVVVANHVLEHVDDAKALAEIHRILAPGGFAILSFPIALAFAKTYENPAITDPRQRSLHFGQHDHLRYYGADAAQRIAAAGFEVEAFPASEPFVHRHSILRDECHFIARKR
jgi:SAM-dependent methyltransferase